jgi:transcriptional regulator with XRE-family HTH domain
MISSGQLRGARALLGLSQADVAARAGVSVPTVKRAEGGSEIKASDKAVQAIAAALEAAGIEFTNGGRPGLRLKPQETE